LAWDAFLERRLDLHPAVRGRQLLDRDYAALGGRTRKRTCTRTIDGCYTQARRPLKLVFAEHYERIDEAIAAERRIKGWSRVKKEAYMRGDFPKLVELAVRRTRWDKKA
jgi:putative endonuclease